MFLFIYVFIYNEHVLYLKALLDIVYKLIYNPKHNHLTITCTHVAIVTQVAIQSVTSFKLINVIRQ